MVKVADAIMGTGKSSAAITYMNEHPGQKFIYITPYLKESYRIEKACPELHFHRPAQLSEYRGSKTSHTLQLVKEGKNIASTHEGFKYYTTELRDAIRDQGYTLILDESVDTLESIEGDAGDMRTLIKSGYLKQNESGAYEKSDDVYEGKRLRDIYRVSSSRELVLISTTTKAGDETYYYWQLPADLITAFQDVFVLTYLFEGHSLYYFLQMNNIPFRSIGIAKDEAGVFRFSETEHYVPPYVRTLPNLIHIIDKPKLNKVGESKTALSVSWFKRGGEGVEELQKNLTNFFRNIAPGSSEDRLWGSYKFAWSKLKGGGYAKSFLTFNTRATNEFRDKTVLAYCVNLYMNVGQKLFYQRSGVEVSDDAYALSNMVQWIWRSAIRDGKEIYLYIPSKRMRTLLTDWIREVSGCDNV